MNDTAMDSVGGRPADDGTIKSIRFAKVIAWLVYAFFIVAVIILTLAFFLLLFNASTSAEFTQWVYRSADRVLEPFRGIFPSAAVGDTGSVVDFGILFAIIMYGIFALVVQAGVAWLDRQLVDRRSAIDRERDDMLRTQAIQAQMMQAQAQQAQLQARTTSTGSAPSAAQAPPASGRTPPS